MTIEFVHKEALREGCRTVGMIRKEAFSVDNVWIGEVRTFPGIK